MLTSFRAFAPDRGNFRVLPPRVLPVSYVSHCFMLISTLYSPDRPPKLAPTRTNSPRPPSGADGNTNGVLHPTDSPHSTPPDANAAATASLSPRSVHTSACFAAPAARTHRRSQRGPRRPQTRPTRRRRQCEGACSWDKLARLAQRREQPRSRGTPTRPTRTARERGSLPQLPISPDSLGCSAIVTRAAIISPDSPSSSQDPPFRAQYGFKRRRRVDLCQRR